ncbi:MAG: hypothetical protein ACFHWX_19810 [Bacteroidota bacterium]
MMNIVFDLLLFGFIYAILLGVLFIHHNRKRRKGDDSDEDGGLPVFNPPELDLPPGICLPGDPIVRKKEQEEVLI